MPCPNWFGQIQIILIRFKLDFSGLIFIIWTCAKWFGPIEGQGISEFHLKLPIFPCRICYLYWSGFEGYWLRIKIDCFRCDQFSILKKAIEPNLKSEKYQQENWPYSYMSKQKFWKKKEEMAWIWKVLVSL